MPQHEARLWSRRRQISLRAGCSFNEPLFPEIGWPFRFFSRKVFLCFWYQLPVGLSRSPLYRAWRCELHGPSLIPALFYWEYLHWEVTGLPWCWNWECIRLWTSSCSIKQILKSFHCVFLLCTLLSLEAFHISEYMTLPTSVPFDPSCPSFLLPLGSFTSLSCHSYTHTHTRAHHFISKSRKDKWEQTEICLS